MNTNQLKNFAKEARIKLISQIGVKLDFVLTQDTAELRGKSSELVQIQSKLIEFGREQLIETVAYTWFNRLMALRFMDANGYNTPKVVTPLPGMSNPEILQNVLAGNIEEELKLDRQRLNDLIDGRTSSSDAQTEAFKLLLVASCNKWHSSMPFMFERISDYTELLLPDDLLSDFSIVSDIKNGMSDDDCQHEEILGWLYQFYISDENERLIKSKNVYKKHELAPASQLFTPKWIVKYMVDNTLGQLWSEINPSTSILPKLEYYIKPDYKKQLQPRPRKNIEEIKFFEPCVGSAHILSYAFDVFFLMYEEQGYSTSEIPEQIIKNNLFGIDIDERAAQIASFVLIMKGRRKNSRILKKNIVPNITFYENFISDDKFNNCKALGSLIIIEPNEINNIIIDEGSVFAENQKKLKKLYTFLGQRYDCVVTNPPYISSSRMEASVKSFLELNYPDTKSDLFSTFIIRCLELCNQDGLTGYMTPFVWMFISSFEKLRKKIIDNHFINNLVQLEYSGFDGATVPVCTFTLQNKRIENGLGSYVRLSDFKGSENQAPKTLQAIKNNDCGWFYLANQNDFTKIPNLPIGYWLSQKAWSVFDEFQSLSKISIPKSGMSTTNNERFVRCWFEVSVNRISSTNQNMEDCINNQTIWNTYNKATGIRWISCIEDIIFWENNGSEIKNWLVSNPKDPKTTHWSRRIFNTEYFFKEGISWGDISSSRITAKKLKKGYIFDSVGIGLYNLDKNENYILGILNSCVSREYLKLLCPTLHFNPGGVGQLPIIIDESERAEIENKTELCTSISLEYWNTSEISFDFSENELIKIFKVDSGDNFKNIVRKYKSKWTDKFWMLHKSEENLNLCATRLYGLGKEIDFKYRLSDITILTSEIEQNKLNEIESYLIRDVESNLIINYNSIELPFDEKELLKQVISYSSGCFFGRFNLNKPGLILANRGENLQDFLKQVPSPSFIPDEDNIIPVLEGEWFNDDIVGRFKVFLKTAFGDEHFEENLKYIEETIGKDIRKYFVKDLYNDHIKRYKKRPIYWMFSSPKGHFKALIYMHRYQPDLCSKMLNDYLQPFISKLEAAKQTNTLLSLREDVSAREKTLALKEVDRLELMIRDCKDYERTLFTVATQKITIDLDDGVKVNYLKFKDVLVPIKGLEKEED